MNFERIRQLLLQKAIEGKLVPQLDEEPPVTQIGEPPKEVPFAIPEKWKWVRISDCLAVNPKVNCKDESEVSFVPMSSVEAGFIDVCKLTESRSWSSVKNGFSKFSDGDVLLAKITPCFQNRKSCIVNGLLSGVGAGSTEFHVLRCDKYVDNKYLLFFIKTKYFIDYGVENFKGTAGQQRIGTKDLKDCLFPLPPIAEQRRIVERLNDLLATLKKAEDAYKDLQVLGNNLRAKVLQQAIEGKLVPQLDEEPPVTQIGEPPKDVPFAIPEKWKWVKMDDVCSLIKRGKSPKYSDVPEIPVIAQKCNQWDGFYIDKAKFIDPNTISKYSDDMKIRNLDVMVNSTGLGTLGRVGIYTKDRDPYEVTVWDSHVTVIRANHTTANPYFIYFFLRSQTVQSVIEIISDGTTNQKELSTKTIKSFAFPLPPIEEQRRIVEKLNALLPLVDQMSA